MATLPELLAQAEIIRTAQNVDENTAQRIGKLYNDIIVYFSNNGGSGGVTSHPALNDKNAEPEFQHVTQEEKTGFHTHTNKEYLDNYNPTLFATALQGEKADSALQSLPPNTVIDADYTTLKDKVNGIEENANNYEHPLFHSTKILAEVSSIAGNIDKYLNQRGDFTKPTISHIDLTYKNDEASFQHIDTTTTKETLAEDDKVPIYDSVTGNVVLTDKTNVGYKINDNTISTTDVWSSSKTNEEIKKRSYTIDFNTHSELAQDSNLLGEITINRILTKNVTELYVSYGSVVRQQVPTSGTVSLSIPDETVLVWEIVRATEGELACVGIRFEILMEE